MSQKINEIETIRNTQVSNSKPSSDKQNSTFLKNTQKPPFTFQEITEAFKRNEDGDAYLFVQLFKNKFVFDHGAREWYLFNGPTWKNDRIRDVQASTEALTDLYRYVLQILKWNETKAKKAGNQEVAGGIKSRIKSLKNRINDLHTLPRKKKILDLAASGQISLGISGEEWDRDPYVLVFQNGVLDLKTFNFREGQPEDYLKTQAKATWKSIDEPAPIWERMLLEIFDENREILMFFQRVVGLSLIGKVERHFFIILWGKGRNGKSLILETIKDVLGDYAESIRSEALVKQSLTTPSSAPTPDVLKLRGKRIVWASETDEGEGLNVGKIKNWTGGDTIVARGMYAKNEVSFEPSHSLFLLTNPKPEIPARDFAIWQRIFFIPFKLAFIENPKKPNERKADPKLGEKLSAEASGIAAWMVRGLQEYNKIGLAPPDEVKAATAEYQRDQDVFQDFLDSETIAELEGKVQAGVLWEAYGRWCAEEGHRRSSRKGFSDALRDRGFAKDDSGRNVFYLGIRLKED